ncbi:MAG TPA: ABC transporter ATP-binding protein [Tissierellaceae bacterium]|nr:ABC transporter ATP-binding protein [Tissierellaceae bacterium]
MKKLLPYMKKYRIYAILTPILMILEVLGDIMLPYLMSRIVDVGIVNRDTQYVVKIGLIMIGATILSMIFGIISAHFGAKAGHGFASEIRKETFKNIQDFSFANLNQFTVSSLVTRLTTDINIIGRVTMMSLRLAIRAPFMLIFALIMAIRINASLTKIFLISIPFTVIIISIVIKKARPLFLKLQTKIDDVNSVIQENLTAIRVVKSFNRQDYEENKFKKRNDSLKDTALEALSLIIFIMPVLNLVIFSTIIAILWFGGQQIMIGSMAGGELISFITYVTQILITLMMMSMFFMQFIRGITSAERIVEVWDTKSQIIESQNPVTELNNGTINFKDVCFAYPGSSENVLRNINFHVESGEVLGIIGSTGSSKSTLVQLIPRLYDVTEGSVTVGGINVKDYDTKLLRDEVAFVLQQNTLFSGTIRSNMQWGNENASDKEIINALKHAQAWEFVSTYDDGLDHKVEQGGSNFSGGQRQRLTIARALMKNPKVIILDDSTSAVDTTTDAKIQQAFKEELGDITTIIIAQRISSIQYADRIMVMHKGEIESFGNHESLLEKSSIYKEIYESQEKGVVGE